MNGKQAKRLRKASVLVFNNNKSGLSQEQIYDSMKESYKKLSHIEKRKAMIEVLPRIGRI